MVSVAGGISVFANGNSAHGKDKGNGTDWTETTIDSGKTVSIKSGNDTVLDGAQVNGNTIIADVGHDLLMSSQQNNNDYDSKQTSVAGGGSFSFGLMSGSGYISVSQDKMKSRFDSVSEQTGLFAGDGGFDITVGNHTQLDGAVIASTATADKNSLDTGTLGFSDIHNEADFKTQQAGGSFNSGGSIAGQFASNAASTLLAGGGNKGHAEGTTQAAIADGTITVRDKASQEQDVADLSRDTEHANDSISPIFDKEKEQNRLKAIGLISDISVQAADIARTQGELAGRKAAKDPASLEEARQQLAVEGEPVTDAAVAERAYNNASSFYGTGGAVQRGIQAATGALTVLAGGGDLAGALAAASAPELANIIGHRSGLSKDDALIAHALLGGVVASLQGKSAAAGAAGALTGELAARAIQEQMFPGKEISDLSESDKQYISNLATIASGLAGNIVSGNSSGTTAGAQAGKNAAENNALGPESHPFGHDDEEEHERELGAGNIKILPLNPGLEPERDEHGNPLTFAPGIGVPIKNGSGVAKGPQEATRYIDGMKIVDQKTGQIFQGQIDLGPTLNRIESGGSFPHRNDGTIFQNRSGDLPQKPAGYYTEYVHPTNGITGPGPQRIVVGKSGEMFYTPDHYKTFIPIKNEVLKCFHLSLWKNFLHTTRRKFLLYE
jgi:filamentous hemagglutinin